MEFLSETPQGKSPLGYLGINRRNRIRIQLIQDIVQRGLLLNMGVNLFEKKVRNFFTSSATVSFSRMALLVGVIYMPQQ
jgi:hypothetical protein